MKRLSAFLTSGIILFFSGCDANKEKEAANTAMDTMAAVIAPITAPAFTPFKVILVRHNVKNFANWEKAYMAHDSMRNAYGISRYAVGRGEPDSNMIVVINKIDDLEKAKEFTKLPDLKDAMNKAGVIGKPNFAIADVVRNDDTKIDQKDRLMVIHNVKDYDTWLKVYDAEGKATRMENGLIDRGMARDVDNPNRLYIVFAISDMAKVKARIASEDLKKVMIDAGVEGKPEIIFYRLLDY